MGDRIQAGKGGVGRCGTRLAGNNRHVRMEWCRLEHGQLSLLVPEPSDHLRQGDKLARRSLSVPRLAIKQQRALGLRANAPWMEGDVRAELHGQVDCAVERMHLAPRPPYEQLVGVNVADSNRVYQTFASRRRVVHAQTPRAF